MTNSKRSRTLLVAGCLVLGASLAIARQREGPAVGARDDQSPSASPELRAIEEIFQVQIKESKHALRIIDQSALRGAPATNNVAFSVYLWSRRLLEAQLYLSLPANGTRTADPEVYLASISAASTTERRAAFGDHLRRLKTWEERSEPLYRSGVMSALDYMDIMMRRVQAEQWVARDRLKKK